MKLRDYDLVSYRPSLATGRLLLPRSNSVEYSSQAKQDTHSFCAAVIEASSQMAHMRKILTMSTRTKGGILVLSAAPIWFGRGGVAAVLKIKC